MIELVSLPKTHYPLLKKYYKQHKVRGKLASHDIAWVALANNHIIACCKFTPVADAWLLSAVHTDTAWRGQKVASSLLLEALKYAPKPLFTFPYRKLISWYQQLGFEICETAQISHAEIVEKWHSYQAQGRDIEIMDFKSTH